MEKPFDGIICDIKGEQGYFEFSSRGKRVYSEHNFDYHYNLKSTTVKLTFCGKELSAIYRLLPNQLTDNCGDYYGKYPVIKIINKTKLYDLDLEEILIMAEKNNLKRYMEQVNEFINPIIDRLGKSRNNMIDNLLEYHYHKVINNTK